MSASCSCACAQLCRCARTRRHAVIFARFDELPAGESLELIPLALIRPLSGSGARGVLLEIYDVHGTDTFIGKVATLLMGSSETTFYVLTVYYGAIQVKKLRHTLPACLLADAAGIVIAIVMGYWLYS